jgi:hypothetical protein
LLVIEDGIYTLQFLAYDTIMFRIFGKTRKDILAISTKNRYLFYAAGELLLVVVGILIALQINNWNEERVEQKEIHEYALNLSASIDSDMEMLVPVEMQMRASIRQAEELATYLRHRTIAEMDNAELFFLTTHIGYRPYAWNRAAIEQLKSAGGLRRMRNRHLAELISDYDALTHHLDQDYREDQEFARSVWDSIIQLVDLNYAPEGLEGILNWEDGFTSSDIERRLTRYQETDQFKLLARMRRPLLSQNLADFRRFANMNREFADSSRARPDIELPRLRQFSTEIQALIDEEYH